MKITSVEIIAADIPFLPREMSSTTISLGTWDTCHFVFVKVFTDNGLVGYGESAPWARTSQMGQMPIYHTLKDYLCPSVIGMDPFNIQQIWMAMDLACPENPQAKGALDMAMYDLMGKASHMPATNFMGGMVRDRIPLQALICLGPLEDMKKQVSQWLERGFKTIRIKTGLGSVEEDIKLIRETRKLIGDDINLRIDPNQAYSISEALRLIPVLEECGIEIYEQPIVWSDVDGLAKITASTYISVMAHEAMTSIYDVRDFFNKKAISLYGLKTDRPGGLTKAILTRDMAELFNIPCIVMSSVEAGISTFASMQLASTIKKLPYACEASGSYTLDDIVDNTGRICDGYFIVPEGEGFGASIDEEKLARYTVGSCIVDARSEKD